MTPKLPDADREQKVRLPEKPSVGEVIGLAVAGERGVILLFEMQATKGSGRIGTAWFDATGDEREYRSGCTVCKIES